MVAALFDQCVKVININIRFRDRLDILKENYILPNCLVEVCKNRYEDDIGEKQGRVYYKIRVSPSYVCWQRIINQPLIYYDKVEISIDRFIICEIFNNSEAKTVCTRNICRRCYELYYSSENWSANIHITHEEKNCFISVFHFDYKCVEFWCNDCLKPIFKLPKQKGEHDAIVQVVKNYLDEKQFKRTHQSISSSTVSFSPPPSPASSIHSYESDESLEYAEEEGDASFTYQLYKQC